MMTSLLLQVFSESESLPDGEQLSYLTNVTIALICAVTLMGLFYTTYRVAT